MFFRSGIAAGKIFIEMYIIYSVDPRQFVRNFGVVFQFASHNIDSVSIEMSFETQANLYFGSFLWT